MLPVVSPPVVTRSTAAGVPWDSRTFRAVLASTLVLPLGVPLISPVLPVVGTALGLTDAQASLLVTAYFLPGALVSPLMGVLADRLGRRTVLVPCLFAFGAAGGAVALTLPYPVVLAVRTVQGSAAAGVFVTTATLLGDAFEDARRNAAMGTTVATLSVGRTVYPVVGGALATVAWNAPFAASLLAVPAGLFVGRTLAERPFERAAGGSTYLPGVARALPTRAAVGLYAATFLVEVVTFGAVITALPFVLSGRFGLSPPAVGAVLAVSTFATAAAAAGNGHLATRFSNGLLVAGGFLCFGVGLVGIRLASTVAAVGVAVAVFGVGVGLGMPSVDAELARLVPVAYRAGALGLRNSVTFFGRATGPVVFTVAAGAVGYPTTMLVAGVATLGLGVVGALAAR